MPPLKRAKKEVTKYEKPAKVWNIEDPINLSDWRCIVTMAVEKTNNDNFVLKIFNEESSKGCRQEVSSIDYSTTVMKILNDFTKGELPYKYGFLLNFSSVFKEAVDYITNKKTIPVLVLVKVVKALLFYLREESLIKIEKLKVGVPDPIEVMTARPPTFEKVETKKKETTKKGDNGFTVRPPSVTKEDTELLKRGERAKDDQRIDDAPLNSYFNLYVLLTGFYDPDFPLELIKAGIPLHAIICIDTSSSGVTYSPTASRKNIFTKNREAKATQIQNFWEAFLKMVWSPKFSYYFKDTILQMYVPRRLLCEKKALRDFIYREISYLMYDMADVKRQLVNYLDHMQLWNVSDAKAPSMESSLESKHLRNECVSVPVVLQYIIDAVCRDSEESQRSFESLTSVLAELERFAKVPTSPSMKNTYGSTHEVERNLSQELLEKGNYNLLQIYRKTVELDEKYELNDISLSSNPSNKDSKEGDSTLEICTYQILECGENMEEAMASDGAFRSYWKKYQNPSKLNFKIDHCLYPLFMTKISCPYQSNLEGSPARSYQSMKKNSHFEIIENLSDEIRKPHFTVTEGSRSILKCVPFNLKDYSRNFFYPQQLKLVSPEKVKASSVPEFRVTSRMKVQATFASEMLPGEISENPFECLRGFVNECVFLNTRGFDFLEFLNKSKLFEKQHDYWDKYNCIDHAYSHLTDSIFFKVHNRKDCHNVHHETFNEILRTEVGLRDFYDYVMEDEAEWIARQEECYLAAAMLANRMLDSDSFRHFSEMDFWLTDSIKFNTMDKHLKEDGKDDIKTEYSSMEKLNKPKVEILKKDPLNSQTFEGYDVSEMSVQYSGLRSVYYSKDCSVTVQLIERLYGSQSLSVHLSVDCHTLHLYSYVCPRPHTLEPFMFHVTYKNGIVVAFGRRMVETIEEVEEVEEVVESRTHNKGKKNSSEFSSRIVKKEIFKTVKDEEFLYDISASIPNGLCIRVVRKTVKPCYIKQLFLTKNEEIAQQETSRLFLPNGNVIKMMNDGTVQILKISSSIVTANLYHLMANVESECFDFASYEVVSGEGYSSEYMHGEVTSSKRFQIFQNTEVNTGRLYFRRRDGTNYLLETDGTFTVQFKDGTRISTKVKMEEPEILQSEDFDQLSDVESDIVIVHMIIIVEHPDYVTVVYDTQTQIWKLLLPDDSTITVYTDGHYSVDVDKQTKLTVEKDLITMNRFSEEGILQTIFTADLTVFENSTSNDYCQLQDLAGKTFVVEANSNCYFLNDKVYPHNFPVEVEPRESDISEFVASADLQICPCVQTSKGDSLSPENKYLAVRRDMTGVEVLHGDEMIKTLSNTQKGSLVYTQNIPGTLHRCFVLISPKTKRKIKKWEVKSILPNPKYEPNSSRRTISSTYGVPPSWMHPFPKRKIPFVIPQPLTCRVFVETKKTDFTPPTGFIDIYNCEMEEEIKEENTIISPGEVEEYFKKLSNDNQDILKEMYALAASSIINQKKKMKPINSEKLERYLALSKKIVEKREYHKACLRYHIVPNYFRHPDGMSWLILNDLLLGLNLPLKEPTSKVSLKTDHPAKARTSDRLPSEISNEEIEYDLSISAEQSYSDLSCRSNLSAHTAPAVLVTGGVCLRCKLHPVRHAVSCAPVKFQFEDHEQSTETSSRESVVRICDFQKSEVDEIVKTKREKKESKTMSLEDLMYLGLV